MNNYKYPVKLPPYTVQHVVATLSQTMDWGLKNLGIPQTWTITKGNGIKVLVIDTGCPATIKDNKIVVHPDLKNCIIEEECKTYINDEGIEDLQGHSSHCTGIIGARNNDIGCVGYAPECSIITYKALDRNGSGGLDFVSEALEKAIETKPDIISMSLGSQFSNLRMHEAIKELYKMNIPVIAAGGNGGAEEGVNYPGEYDEVITIGAYDINNNIANFSAVGSGIDFAFPGVQIYSTYLNGGYAKLSGTSMATPACAGVVALLLAKHRKQEQETGQNDCKTVDQIKDHLKKYSVDKGIIGKDDYFGWGIVDVQKMISTSENGKPITHKPEIIEKSPWQKFKDWIWNTFCKPL